MPRDGPSVAVRLIEAQTHLQRAYEDVADDQPELADSLADVAIEVDELRELVAAERTTN